ncbi:MAG: hypothetical protein L6R42_003440 [Xanthoria sp. 1 TBL-2021]|nr:MAG: hypothetical protein L6R42_003440 [Xanthoria sp. 1 TBL-2021]
MVRLSHRVAPVGESPVVVANPPANDTNRSPQCPPQDPSRTEWALTLPSPSPGELLDLVCVGFGPAALGIGLALQDACETSTVPLNYRPKVAFIESQSNFAWHVGMQLAGAKMQISFIKDLATQRNPRSRFTFLNYLWTKGRLNQYANLSTFRPSRIEYQDYLNWCAQSFFDLVHYGEEVIDVSPSRQSSQSQSVDSFLVTCRDVKSGNALHYRTRHVVVAAGGRPNIPSALAHGYSTQTNIIHSSQCMTTLPHILPDPVSKYRIAVVGGGQSGAEIFSNVQTAFPNAQTSLIIRGGALRPTDDSPFVNEIFDPEQTANMFHRKDPLRAASIIMDKATNYGVVRLELIERIYENLYAQSLLSPPGSRPQNRILRYRTVTGLKSSPSGAAIITCENATSQYEKSDEPVNEQLDFDAVILATGYVRDLHLEMLKPLRRLAAQSTNSSGETECRVKEDYRVIFESGKVDQSQAGIWLQGCNEKTHGVSMPWIQLRN